MGWNAEFILSVRILFAAILGSLIGWERENHNRDAGVRTYMANHCGRASL